MESVIKRNNVNVIGNGEQVMLFAHGFGCDLRSWQLVVDAFTDDYRVVLFDYVGSGKSDLSQYSSAKYGRLEGYAQDILDVCEALSLREVIFVGHSVSAMIGAIAAVREPAYFKKLVFIGPSPCYLNEEGYTGGFERADLESLFEFMDSNYLGWSSSHQFNILSSCGLSVNADRDKIGQVINNMLNNAVKYSPRGGNVNVTCSASPDGMQLSIQDEGIGVKHEDQEKLFDRYYRIDSHTHQISGFGIELYLCSEIIQRHNGKIWVESEVGKGSTFYFSIPLS